VCVDHVQATVQDGFELREVPIVENGASVHVTGENVRKFIRDMANFRLNRQIEVQSQAFLRGFYKVIDKDWWVRTTCTVALVPSTRSISIRPPRLNLLGGGGGGRGTCCGLGGLDWWLAAFSIH
jgi:hypothetical protein